MRSGVSAGSLLIRADAGVGIGTGHVMRCLALAQMWLDSGGTAKFISAAMPKRLEERLHMQGLDVSNEKVQAGEQEDVARTVESARRMDADWVAVDGYQFDAEFQESLKNAGLRVLFVDDFGHAHRYSVDIVLNQNVNADAALYRDRARSTQLLLGPSYALLRREFLAVRGSERSLARKARRVLVTIGGSDPANVTALVLDSLNMLGVDRLEVRAVVGPANLNGPGLRRKSVDYSLELVSGVDMPGLMNWADVAISAAGITTWELLYLGVPSLLVIAADNQRTNAETLDASGAAINLGCHEQLRPAAVAERVHTVLTDSDLRLGLRDRGRRLVDGKGTRRVLECMGCQQLEIRRATPDDARLLWEWRNEEQTRAASFSTAPIPWEAHLAWFKKRLEDPATLFYVAVRKGDPVGHVRYDLEGNRAVVTVSVARECRGQGYGKELLRRGAEKVFEETGKETIHAYVKPSNRASQQAFLQAGFKQVGRVAVRAEEAILLVWER